MDNLITAKINTLENQIAQLQIRRFGCELQIEDAATPTGNDAADLALKNDAATAANTIAMIDKQLETREPKLTELKAIFAAAGQQPAASPAVPPTIGA